MKFYFGITCHRMDKKIHFEYSFNIFYSCRQCKLAFQVDFFKQILQKSYWIYPGLETKSSIAYIMETFVKHRYKTNDTAKLFLDILFNIIYVMRSSKMSPKSKNMIFGFLTFSIRVLFWL